MAPLSYGHQFDVFTDNSACSWLLHHPKVSPKLDRYLTTFAQYTFTIHITGAPHFVAGALSRRPSDSTTSPIQFYKCDSSCQQRKFAFTWPFLGANSAPRRFVGLESICLHDSVVWRSSCHLKFVRCFHKAKQGM